MDHLMMLIISWYDNEVRFEIDGIDWKNVGDELERIINTILANNGNVVIKFYKGCDHCQKPRLHYVHGVSHTAYTRQMNELNQFLASSSNDSYTVHMEEFVVATVAYLLSQLISIVNLDAAYGPSLLTKLIMLTRTAGYSPTTEELKHQVVNRRN